MITQGQFCYWDCKSPGDAMIIVFNIFITILLAIYSIYSFAKMSSSTHGEQAKTQYIKAVRKKYLVIIIWAISFVAINVYSLVVYFFVFKDETNQKLLNITLYSKIYAFIQTIPALAVQTLLLMTVNTMFTNGMGYLLDQQHQPNKFEMKIYKFLNIYNWARIIFLVSWILILMPFQNVEAFQICTQIKIVLLMIDCGIIVYMLRFCHVYLLNKSETLLPNSQKQRTRLSKQTKMLIMCGVSRFILDFVFYIIFPFVFSLIGKTQDQNYVKTCLEPMNQHLEFSIVYLIMGTYLMHHFSILAVLKIYKPTISRQSLRNSQTEEFTHN